MTHTRRQQGVPSLIYHGVNPKHLRGVTGETPVRLPGLSVLFGAANIMIQATMPHHITSHHLTAPFSASRAVRQKVGHTNAVLLPPWDFLPLFFQSDPPIVASTLTRRASLWC
jgi:hypothetical protein